MIIKEKFNNFTKRRFVRDTAILQTSGVFSIGLSFLASIIFARILGPDNYGIYSLIFALTAFIGIFVGLGADYTILTLLPEAYAKKDKREIKNILAYFFKITLIFTVLVNLIAIVIAPLISEILYDQKDIGQLARWILAASIIQVFLIFLILVLQSTRKIKRLAILENTQKLFYSLVPILLVLWGLGLLGIVWGRFLAEIILFMIAFFGYKAIAKKDELLPSFSEIFFQIFKVKIKQYFKLGLWITLDKKISNLIDVLPVVLLGIIAITTSQVAYFKITLSYLGLSLILLTPISRLLTVQLPKSKAHSLIVLKRDFWKSSIFSGVIYLFIILFFVIMASFLVNAFYGEDYLICVGLIYALSLSKIFGGFTVGYGTIFRVFNKLKVAVIINIVSLFLALLIFLTLQDIMPILKLIILIVVIMNWFTFFLATYFIRRFFKEIKE
ncbi:oligosaccharide flippase family protein [Patescibacteria group bacterium]|nr:oligosaccharide flippase family protein [Patescibacteria group bacterium]